MAYAEPKWVRATIEFLVRIRWISLAAILAVSAASLFLARSVRFDGSIEVWFLEGDEDIAVYDNFRSRFGQDEFIIVGLFGDEVFQKEFLNRLGQLTDEAQTFTGVRDVISLSNVEILEGSDRKAELGPLFETVPETDEQMQALRQRVLAHPMLTSGLIGDQGRATCVIITLNDQGKDADAQGALLGQLKQATQKYFLSMDPPPTIRFSGTPVVNDGMFRFARRDLMTTVPIAVGLVVVCSLLLFRHWLAPLVPLSVVGFSVIWVSGLMGLSGYKATILSSPLMLLILVVGVADSIHMLSAYQYELRAGRTRRQAVVDGLSHVFIPCLFTSLTTVAGFLSLTVSQLQPIREFGLLSAFGVTAAFILSFSLLPVLLPWVRPKLLSVGKDPRTGVIERALSRCGRPNRAWSLGVVIVTFLLVIPCVWAISTIQTSGNPMNYFREGTSIRDDTIAVDQHLGGSSSMEFMVEAPNRGLLDYERLERIDEFERWLEREIGISQCTSIVDLLKEYERVRLGEPAGEATMPHPRRVGLVMRRFEQHSPEDFASYVQDDYSVSRISARVDLAGADELLARIGDVESRLRNEFSGDDLRLTSTGFVKLIAKMQSYVVSSQINSFALAAVVITFLMFLLLRSWKLGLISIFANYSPILFGLGLMGALGIALDPGTVMIATVSIGLVVDNSCHFLVRLKTCVGQGMEINDAVHATMISTGRPIVLSSIILIAGFLSLGFGSFNPTIYFGLITAAVIFLALITSLVFLPALLVVLQPKLAVAAQAGQASESTPPKK